MSRSIAIVGATGAVGSALTVHILRSGLLRSFDRIQLVGHNDVHCTAHLHAIRTDLLDAFDDQRVVIEVAEDISQLNAQIVVLAAGIPIPAHAADRRVMASANVPIFETMADACARYAPDAFYLVVSNPVELAVGILCRRINRKRVCGVGAEQDSLRFARAIGHNLGLSRNEVRASVWGEHGRTMVPVWSTVTLIRSGREHQDQLQRLRDLAAHVPLAERVHALQIEVVAQLQASDTQSAYALAERALPDARIVVEPFITASEMHSTPNATANTVLQFLRTLIADGSLPLHAQVELVDEYEGLTGPCGVPITLTPAGWTIRNTESLCADERDMVQRSNQSIQQFIGDLDVSFQRLGTVITC
jgi:malate dehydrogenase